MRDILRRLKLELHPEKTKRVELSWGNYFRTGNASIKFQQIDSYVWWRLHRFMVKRRGGMGFEDAVLAEQTDDVFGVAVDHRVTVSGGELSDFVFVFEFCQSVFGFHFSTGR